MAFVTVWKNLWSCSLALAFAVSLYAETSSADEAPKTNKQGYSSYEKDTIADALKAVGGEVDPAPEGKYVEGIDVVRLEVFEERDPLPRFAIRVLNSVHTTSKDWVIRREALMEEGQQYSQALLDETERNLRRLSAQVTVGLAVPMKGSAPDRVRVLVISKDVWSLRLNWDLQANSGGLESLTLKPSETNLFGIHHVAAGSFQYAPESYTLGGSYNIPRFGKSYIGANADAAIIMNSARGEPEGSVGSFVVGQPLYTTRTPWAWSAGTGWTTSVYRRYSNAKVFQFDSNKTSGEDRIPFQYEQRLASVSGGVTRSFGWQFKHDVSVNFGYSSNNYRTFDLSAYNPIAADDFRSRLPVSDARSGPSVQYHSYTTNYHRITDFETLGLQEDYRLGHDIYVQAYPMTQALGSTRTFLGVFGSAQYTVPMGTGLARVSIESTTEAEETRLADASWEARARFVSPRFLAGRLVFDAGILNRYRNYLNRQTVLGGDTRLRGYPSRFFQGSDFWVYNLEYRSRPIRLASLYFGGAIGYDVGDAFDGFGNFRPKQGVGVGLRVLIPQLNRIVFRADLGIPLTRPLPRGVDPITFFVAFGQAFDFGTAGP